MEPVSRHPGYVIGYHGTSAKVARAVVLGKRRLDPSTNSYDWLGKGVYFWEGSVQRAEEWAHEQAPTAPAVLGAVISLGHCLDLLDRRCADHVIATYKTLKAEAAAAKTELPVNKGKNHALDCLVLNHAVDNPPEDLPTYDSVRAAFHEGEVLAPRSGIYAQSHIQVAIHNPNCIKGYFLPVAGDLDYRGV